MMHRRPSVRNGTTGQNGDGCNAATADAFHAKISGNIPRAWRNVGNSSALKMARETTNDSR
jgi:hypothetical protein